MNELSLYGTQQDHTTETRRYFEAGQAAYRRHISPSESWAFLEEALNQYACGLELDPDNQALMLATGQAMFRKGNHEKAEHWAKRCLALNARSAEAHAILGKIAYKNADFEKATTHLGKAIGYAPLGSARSRLELFRVLRDASRPSLVSNGFQGFARMTQSFWYLLSGLATLPLDSERLEVGAMTKMAPELAKVYLTGARQNPEAALKIYLELSERYPGLASLMLVIADLYDRTGAPSEALYWYRKCLERHPGHEEARYRLAQHLEGMQRNDEAAELYEELMTIRPNDAFIYCHLGNVHYALQNYQNSLEFYKAALHLGLRQGESPSWRALLAQSIGNLYAEFLNNPEAAEASYLMAIDLDPGEVDNYIQLGLLYFQGEDYGNARLIYESAIKVAPTNAKLYSNLGYLCWMSGDLDSAIPYYEKAIQYNPTYDIPHNNLGVIYLDAIGDVYKAIDLLEKTIELNENYALAYYNLGRAYSFVGQSMKAATCFQMAQRLNHYTCELDNEELDARINYLFTATPEAY